MWVTYFLFFTLILSCYSDNVQLLVKTPLGEVQGYHKTSYEGRTFSAFEGIRFAKPPIGERRFEEPEPIEPWSGIWNATVPTVCLQTQMIQVNETHGDEDCLHINVYVPRETPNSEENLDVIVHIHGGAYMYGSGHTVSRPDVFMDRDIIFVNFNYRLNIFGFLSTEDDVVPGNNGLKDQVMALKWVQKNIASFGGNPDSVTITGLSAGASSVHLHYFSKLSKGLFHRGFAQSGLALNPWSIQEDPLVRTKILADSLACPTGNTRVMVDCLKQKPHQQILSKMALFFVYLFIPIVPFGPVVEKGGSNPFLKKDPYYLLSKGKVHDLPLLASITTHEGIFPTMFFVQDLDNIDKNWKELAPSLLDFDMTLPKAKWDSASVKIKKFYFDNEKISVENYNKLVDMFSDRFFATDAETAVRLQSKVTKSPVYYYIFGYPGDNNKQRTVGHAVDSKYFFGRDIYIPVPLSENERKMKDLLIDMVVSFAKTGTPRFGDAEWKPTEYDTLTYLSVKGINPEEINLETTEELTTRKFWKSLNFLEGENLISVKEEL